MTSYEIYSLFVDTFTAVGTCGATALALFFWHYEKKIKLGYRVMHANAYGGLPDIDGGYFVVTVTNLNPQPITIEAAGLKCYEKKCFFRKHDYYALFTNTIHHQLPRVLQYGETYAYQRPMQDAIRDLQSIERSEEIKINDLKIILCIATAGKDILHDPGKHVKSILLARR